MLKELYQQCSTIVKPILYVDLMNNIHNVMTNNGI